MKARLLRPLFIFTFVFVAILFGTLPPAWSAPPTPRVETLQNGLGVVLLEDHSAPLVAAAVWVHAGGKDEREELAGFSHYLEHLIPQGSENRIPRQEQLEVFRAGGLSLIQADYDRTFFYVEVGTEALEGALDSLLRQVSKASLADVGVERIRPFITRELRTVYNDPRQVLFFEQMRGAFQAQPYRFPYYGNFESLASLERSSADAFYSNFYVPNNMVVAVGGDIHPGRTLTRIKELFGVMRASKTLPPKPKFEGSFTGPRQVVKKLALLEPSVSLLFPTPGYRHPDRYALAVLGRMLEETLVPQLGRSTSGPGRMILSASARYHLLEERGLLAVSGVPLSPAAAPEAARTMLSALKNLRREGFLEADVRKVAKQMQLETAVRRDPLGPLVQDLAEAALFGDVRYGWNLEESLGRVTASDVGRVARTYLVAANTKTLIILPEREKDLPKQELDRLAESVASLEAEGESGPKPDFAARLYPAGKASPLVDHGNRRPALSSTRTILPGGLTLLLKPDRGRGLVAASLQVRAGSAYDPPGKEGLAQMVALALSVGSSSIPAKDFRERAQAIGNNLGIAASREQVEAGLTVFPVDLPEALTLLSRPVAEPNFAEDQMVPFRDGIRRFEEARSRSTVERARELLHEKLYRGHPYGRPLTGTEASRASISRENLVAFHRDHYRPDRAVLTLVGDFDPAVARRMAGEAFAAWVSPPGEKSVVEPPGDANRELDVGEFSRMLDELPSVVMLGFPGVPLRDPDYPTLRALGTVLSARGFLDLVLEQPRALSVVAVPEGLARGGILYLEATALPSEAAQLAYELMLRVRALGVKEVSPETISDVTRIEKGRLLREKEGIYTLASNLGFYELLGPGFAAYDGKPSVPPDLTPAALKEAAARYLRADRLVRVTVGPLPR